jgi:hypothetical protein
MLYFFCEVFTPANPKNYLCDMRIAILVWGSLYWDKRNLETTDEWFYDGPVLPIEFARISNGNRLTLVIKPAFDNVITLYAISAHDTLAAARENLRSREGTENVNNIGFIDFTTNTQQVRQANAFMIDILSQWNTERNFDAIIWSDFSPRFSDAINQQFTLQNVITFIDNLPEAEKRSALQYIRNTPHQINTRFRNAIEQRFEEAYL